MSQGEIENIIQRAEDNKTANVQRKDFVRQMNKLEGMIHTLERTNAEYGTYLNEEEQKRVRDVIAAARKAISTENRDEVFASSEKISQVSKVLSEVVMFNPVRKSRSEPDSVVEED